MTKFFKANWVIILISLLALFMRFWQIQFLPGGLFPDEAANGLDINSILQGHIEPFYERGNGREALFFYIEAFSVMLFGRGVWQFHIVSAMFGFLATVATYFLTKRMFGGRIALLATFFMAVSSFAVTISRTAFRANTVPLFCVLTLFFLVKFFQTPEIEKKSRYISASLAGLCFALGFYTYTSFRMMLPLLLGFAILLFWANRNKFRPIFQEYTKYKAAFVASFIVGISWIAFYFIKNPKSFVGRSGQVSVFNEDLNQGDLAGTLLKVFKQTILSFFTEGDLNWRHNVSGFPLLSPFLSPFFAIALVVSTIYFFILLKQVWQKKIQAQTVYLSLTGVWFWFMIVPEISTAEGIPHGLRLIGTIPSIFILTAWGINWAWEKLGQFEYSKKYNVYFAGIFLIGVFVYNFYLYFGIAANSTDYYYAFRSDLTPVSQYLNQRNEKNKTYLSLDKFSVQTVDYLTSDRNQPYTLVDPAKTYLLQLKSGDQVIFTMSTLYDRIKFTHTHPKAQLLKQERNRFGQVIMLVYQQ